MPNIIAIYILLASIEGYMRIFALGKIVKEIPPMCDYISGFGETRFDIDDI